MYSVLSWSPSINQISTSKQALGIPLMHAQFDTRGTEHVAQKETDIL